MSYVYKNETIRCLVCGSRVKIHNLRGHGRACRKTGTPELLDILDRVPPNGMTLGEYVRRDRGRGPSPVMAVEK